MRAAERSVSGTRLVLGAAIVAVLATGFLLTAPVNHATALDSYSYAYFIRDFEIGTTPQVRVYLWTVTMQVLHAALGWLPGGSDPFVTIGLVNALLTALSVLLLKDLLTRRFRTSEGAAWLTALGFGASYGVWRYAGELEVYAASWFVSLALLHAAFSVDKRTEAVPRRRIVWLALGGGLATLFYQPLGIVAGLVVPAYLAFRLPLRAVAGYLAVSGVVVLAGLAYQFHAGVSDVGQAAAARFLDTSGGSVAMPRAEDVPRALVAFLQNVASVNWAYSFPASRAFIEETSGHAFRVYLHAAGFSGPGYLVFLVTVPLLGALSVAALVAARRSGRPSGLNAQEGAVLLWLALHVAMVMLIHPASFEAWIPALPPLFILVGLRLAEPLVRGGQGRIGLGALSVLVVHNWLAGIAVLSGAEQDYYQEHGAGIATSAGRKDLVVVTDDWFLSKYLAYNSEAPVVFLPHADEAATRALVDTTLSLRGRVLLVDGSPRVNTVLLGGRVNENEHLSRFDRFRDFAVEHPVLETAADAEPGLSGATQAP